MIVGDEQMSVSLIVKARFSDGIAMAAQLLKSIHPMSMVIISFFILIPL
jgi:hypothetical protein